MDSDTDALADAASTTGFHDALARVAGGKDGSRDSSPALRNEYAGRAGVSKDEHRIKGEGGEDQSEVGRHRSVSSGLDSSAASYTASYFVPYSPGGASDTRQAKGGTSAATSNSRGSAKRTRGGGGSRTRGGSKSTGSRGELLKPRPGAGVAKSSTTSGSSNGTGTRGGRKNGCKNKKKPFLGIKKEPLSDDDEGVDDDDDDDIADNINDNNNDSDDKDGGDSDNDEEGGDITDSGPYCICRGPDDHRWMIQCDRCEDWFHGDCVNFPKAEGEHVVISYVCPNCEVPDSGFITRFRKLCSLSGCTQPARLYSADGFSAADPHDASHFCSDEHRDLWWDGILASLDNREGKNDDGTSLPEDKLAIGQLTAAQLVHVLSHTDEKGVANMLLYGLAQDKNAQLDSFLTEEELIITRQSAAERARLADHLDMCGKMLQLLEMAKTRAYEAVRAGAMDRDSCSYDDRLQHVGVQPHFEHFLVSPQGQAIFREGKLGAVVTSTEDNVNGKTENNNGDADDNGGDDNADDPATAGMCRRRRCKAHMSWLPTLARDVRLQMQELASKAATLRDNEIRIQTAAVQQAFLKQHTMAEVRYVESDEQSSGEDGSFGDDDDDDNSDAASLASARRRYWSAASSRSRSPYRPGDAEKKTQTNGGRQQPPNGRLTNGYRVNGHGQHADGSHSEASQSN